ncbi:MAG: hypothetical protein KDA22_03585 [Phycisphaerales bacterium]|nr:hypothetical protein [Phycisphaerales bacterium]
MTPRERFQRMEAVFRAAGERKPDDREAFVAEACADDIAMREEVLGMLRVDAHRSGVLDRPALGRSFRLGDHAPDRPADVAVPVRIGRYRIVGVLGEGGMGVVYEALQANPNRRVALKVMSGHAPSQRSVRRFRQEAEVLGRLQHPGIGQIFEAGVDDWGSGPQPFLAIAPTLDRVATGDEPNRPIQVRNMDDGRILLEIDRHSAAGPVTFSSDARLLAIADADDGGVSVHAIDDGRIVRRRSDLGAFGDLCFDRDGTTLAVGAFDGSVHLLDLRGEGEDRVLAGHAGPIGAMAYSPDGSILASAASDHTVRLWDATTGQELAVMQGNDDTPTGIALSPDGAKVATACNDGVVRIWTAAPGHGSFVLPTPGPVYGLAFEPSAKHGADQRLWAACLGGEHPLRCWDMASISEIAALGGGYPSVVAFDASGVRLAVGSSQSGPTVVLDDRGQEITSLPGHWWRTDWVGFGADGSKLLSAGNSRRIVVHDLATRRELAVRTVPGRTNELGLRAALSPDRSLLAVGDEGAIVNSFAPAERAVVEVPGPSAVAERPRSEGQYSRMIPS